MTGPTVALGGWWPGGWPGSAIMAALKILCRPMAGVAAALAAYGKKSTTLTVLVRAAGWPATGCHCDSSMYY